MRARPYLAPALARARALASAAIRVDLDVLDLIARESRPMIDTPNSTLRRLLGLPPVAHVERRAARLEAILVTRRAGKLPRKLPTDLAGARRSDTSRRGRRAR